MSNDFSESGPDHTKQPVAHSGFRSGLTNYERPRGLRGRKNNPYSRSNMIYAKKKRRWPFVLLVVILLIAVVAIVFFACHAEEFAFAAEQVSAVWM